jgi:Carboxypeptidase regulatory-like domain
MRLPLASSFRLLLVALTLSLALSFSISFPVRASASTFELTGTILDESGAALKDATITLVHQDTGLTRSVTTSESGRYSFAALPPGAYSLTAHLAGYATSRFAGLRYFADTKPIFNIVLRTRDVQESMTFTGEAPLLNVSQSQVGLSVEERQLEELPLRRRDYLELATLEGSAREIAEGPPGEPIYGAPLLSLNGASAHYTAYQLDGFQNTRDEHGVALEDVSLDAVEEFRVVSGQFSAEYGRSLGGIVTATTRSGGNDFHGSLVALVRPGGWDAPDPLTHESTARDRQDVSLTFSGPIRREKTHFFADFEYRNQDEDAVVTAPFDDGRYRGVVTLPSDRTRALLKLSHRFDERHQLTLKGVFANQTSREGAGGFDVAANASDVRNDDAAVYGTLVSQLGAALSELRFGFARERFRATAGAPPLGAAVSDPLQGNIGSSTRLDRTDEDHAEFSETLSASSGSHDFTAGLSYLRIGSTSDLERYGDGVFFYPAAPDPVAAPALYWQSYDRSAGALSRSESHVQAFFQDDWQGSPYWTLNLGLRWEKESSVPDGNNFAPRFGFHWDATHDGRTSVRGGYGIYYSSVFSLVDTLERLYGPSRRSTVALSLDRSNVVPPDIAGRPANVYVEAPIYSPENRRSPYAQHASLGFEREWIESLSIAVDLSYIRGADLLLPSDLNAPAFFDYSDGATRSASEADATRPFGVPGAPIPPGATPALPDGLPFSGYRDLYLIASRGSSQFWGVRVRATKRYQSSFTLSAVYQWSRTENDGDDVRVGGSLPLDPARPEGEWGRSATDIPHSFLVNGVWDAPFGVRVAGILRARSGRPVDPLVGIDLDGDLRLRERAFTGAGRILARNSFRAPSSTSLDLSVGKIWELGETRRLEGRLDVLNVTNHLDPLQILSAYGASATPLPQFLQVVQADSPRQFQLSVRFAF